MKPCHRHGRRTALPALLAAALWALPSGPGCAQRPPPPAVAHDVDLARYAGRWYEIASFPQWFQRGCVATRATYTLRADGRLDVVNECRDETFDGEIRRANGVAWPVDPEASLAKLKVQFIWPFSGDYWIIDLDPEYRFAAVGSPSRKYLWILSRTPTMDPGTYEALLRRVASKGYDLGRLRVTPQPAPDAPGS